MKRLAFALTGAAALALAGCGGNQDQVNNAEMNQPSPDELNELSNQAAMDAANAEAAALGNQEAQLNEAPPEDTTSPTDEQEQNVSGM